MKKIIPVLFVSATTLIAVVGVCGTFNGSFRQLHAEDHEYTVTFTSSDITSSGGSFYDSATFSFSKKTKSGFDFGSTATVKADNGSISSGNRMVEVEFDDSNDDVQIQMAFEFHNVSSAVSVVLKGNIDKLNSKTYTNATTIADGYKIAINDSFEIEEDFYIDSIVVKYTCSY